MLKNILVFGALSLSTMLFADSPNRPGPRNDHSVRRQQGSYAALAFGLKDNNHGQTFGFYVRGYGNSQVQAEQNALDRCNTISQGRGCSISD